MTGPEPQRRTGGDDGVSLIEVLVAMLVLTVVSTSAAAVFVSSLRTTTEQSAQQRAIAVATRALETVQSVPASQVLMGRRQAAVQALLSTAVMAPLVALDITSSDNFDPTATAASVPVIPLQREEVLEGTRYQVRTAINNCYLSRARETCEPTPGTDGVLVLRATVNVTWGAASCTRCTYSASALVDRQGDPMFALAQSVPIIQEVTPGSVSSGTTVPITIVGAVFQVGADVTLSAGGGSISGVTRSADGTTINATWAAGTTAGSYVLTVTNPDGGTATYSLTITAPAPAPTISSVTPNSVVQSTTQSITITGTGFQTGVTASLPTAAGTLTGVVRVSATSITATWAAGATTGPHTLTVRNPDAREATSSLTVTAPALSNPLISSVTPPSGAGATTRTITITGSDLRAGLGLTLSSGGGTLANVTWVNSTTVTASLTTASTYGSYVLTLTNSDGRSATASVGVTPTATANCASTPYSGNYYVVDVQGNDTPSSGGTLAITSQPSRGTASLLVSNGRTYLVYERQGDSGGVGTFTMGYTLTVNGQTSAAATVTVKVGAGAC